MTIEEINDRTGDGMLSDMMAKDGDGHSVPNPTHMVVEDDVIIGCFSVAQPPWVFFWMHTQRANVFHSLKAFRHAESLLADQGYDNPLLLIEPKSPFYPFMKKLGYDLAGKGEIFLKG